VIEAVHAVVRPIFDFSSDLTCYTVTNTTTTHTFSIEKVSVVVVLEAIALVFL